MTRTGLEPMIYYTRGDHDDHYTTDAVPTNHEKILTLFYNDDVCVVKYTIFIGSSIFT